MNRFPFAFAASPRQRGARAPAHAFALTLTLTLTAACSSTSTSTPSDTPAPTDAGADVTVVEEAPPDPDLNPTLIAGRPYQSKAPAGADATTALPLVLALHGRGDTGSRFVRATGLVELADAQKFLLAYPDGTDLLGASGWEIVGGVEGVADDVAYLRAVIADMASKHKVDTKRIVVVGLSMGGLMANRLACTASDKIAGILSFAGSLMEAESTSCAAKRPTTVTLVHGTSDGTVSYDGGTFPIIGKFLSAPALYDYWAKRNGCAAETTLPARDLDAAVTGDESTGVTRACAEGTTLTFYTVKGGAHVISMPTATLGTMVEGLLAKPRQD